MVCRVKRKSGLRHRAPPVHDKTKATLAELIAKVNDLFAGDLTPGDKLVYFNDAIKGKTKGCDGGSAQQLPDERCRPLRSACMANASCLAEDLYPSLAATFAASTCV